MKFDNSIKKNFGFGCMRLPLNEDKTVNEKEFTKMVDAFMEAGFNYFDTAHVYLSGQSEIALKHCLTSRYPRESYVLTNKISRSTFNTKEDVYKVFNDQLEACGVEYFDFLLLHAQNATTFEKYKKAEAYEVAFEFKKQGKVKHVGISFHDTVDVLEKILTTYPEIEVVQLQFNYLDYDDECIQSRKCYELCVKYNKPVIVMEPVKGGILANLTDDATKYLDDLNGGSPASYAIRFAASFDNIFMVLSGMSSLSQTLDNISFMKDFKPINKVEREAILKVVDVFKSKTLIACTGCRYCVDGCPKKILIPDLFTCYNSENQLKSWNAAYYFRVHTTNGYGHPNDCIKCGACEKACPQKLPIRELLVKVADTFNK